MAIKISGFGQLVKIIMSSMEHPSISVTVSLISGKIARNVTYQDCCIVQSVVGAYAFICDT